MPSMLRAEKGEKGIVLDPGMQEGFKGDHGVVHRLHDECWNADLSQ